MRAELNMTVTGKNKNEKMVKNGEENNEKDPECAALHCRGRAAAVHGLRRFGEHTIRIRGEQIGIRKNRCNFPRGS